MPTTNLTRTIALLYRMEDADVRQLEEQLLQARKKAWTTALRSEAQAHGCNRVPNAPRREDLQRLKDMCKEDAKSIAATWNRQVTAEIERLFQANRRTNRFYYMKRLEEWDRQRREWKLPAISLNTDMTTRSYAQEKFRKMNYDGGQRFIFVGAAPVCKECASLFAAGVVTEAYIRRHPAPVHPGCSHEWQPTVRPRIRCEDLWLG